MLLTSSDRLHRLLEEAREHLEASTDEPGRVGLAYAQVVLAIDELIELEKAPTRRIFIDEPGAGSVFVSAEQREAIRLACERATERLRLIGVAP